jgi:hypothetical protein
MNYIKNIANDSCMGTSVCVLKKIKDYGEAAHDNSFLWC